MGFVQGLTEFLPISSTAHLRIAPELFGQPDPGSAFTAVLQLGTLLAVLIYYARDIFWDIPRGVLRKDPTPEKRLVLQLIIATIPIVIAGVLLKPLITGPARALPAIASMLAVVALFMLWGESRYEKQEAHTTLPELSNKHALLIGLAQACALFPGVSRSGATITAALFLGMLRPDAARFSFLLSIPAIGGAALLEMPEVMAATSHSDAASLGPLLVGIVVAGVVGYSSIRWLLAYISTSSFRPFAFYRIAVGVVLLATWWSGR